MGTNWAAITQPYVEQKIFDEETRKKIRDATIPEARYNCGGLYPQGDLGPSGKAFIDSTLTLEEIFDI